MNFIQIMFYSKPDKMEVLLLTKSNAIVPFILTDEPKVQIPTAASKPKLACQLKIGATELRIYKLNCNIKCIRN